MKVPTTWLFPSSWCSLLGPDILFGSIIISGTNNALSFFDMEHQDKKTI